VAHPISTTRKRNRVAVTSQPSGLENQTGRALMKRDSANVMV
jgi:hypothetical protein